MDTERLRAICPTVRVLISSDDAIVGLGAEEHEASYGHAAVPLSNSVCLCDMPRLRAAVAALSQGERAGLTSGGRAEPRPT